MMRSCRCKRLGGATGAVLAVAASAATLLGAMSSSAVPAHPDDKTILHVLNRVSFGPRPGDVARVREMGLESYIDQQLHPERIADTSMNARLNGLTTLTKSSREIADDYFIPAMRARVEAKKNAPTGNDASRDDSREARANAGPDGGAAKEARGRRGAVRTEDPARRLQRAPARGSDDRLLVQPLQRRSPARARRSSTSPSTSATRSARTCSASSAICSARPRRARRCCSISTTGRAPTRTGPIAVSEMRDRLTAAARSATGVAGQRCCRPPQRAAASESRRRRGINENYGARADGAAHARRRRRLHAGGRGRRGARIHRLDDRRLRARAAASASSRDCTTRARRSCSVTRSRRAAGEKTASRCSTFSPASVDGALHRDEAGAPVRRRHAAAGARRSCGGAIPGDRWRHPRGHADDPDVARILCGGRLSREGQDAVRVRRLRGAGDRRRRAGRAAARADVQQLGMPLYFCQPPTGYEDTADAWVNTGALLNRMNFALALAGEQAARRAGGVRLPDRRRRVADLARRRCRGDARDARQATDTPTDAGADPGLAGVSSGERALIANVEMPNEVEP